MMVVQSQSYILHPAARLGGRQRAVAGALEITFHPLPLSTEARRRADGPARHLLNCGSDPGV